MSTQHTPEWPEFEDFDAPVRRHAATTPDDDWVAVKREQYNYARIRVKACAGIDDEALWILVEDNDRTLQMYITELKQQNAELLAVMEKAAKHIEENGLVSNCKYASGWLREAIAKAGA